MALHNRLRLISFCVITDHQGDVMIIAVFTFFPSFLLLI